MKPSIASRLTSRAIAFLLIFDGFISGMPQAVRIVTRKSSEDVSIPAGLWMVLMACLWAYKAHQDRSPVLFWGSLVWAVTNYAVCVSATIYRS